MIMLSRNDIHFGIERFPDRKKPCLVVGNEYCVQIVGTFTNDDAAKIFEQDLRQFFDGILAKEDDGENGKA